jgi:hypothetical protein
VLSASCRRSGSATTPARTTFNRVLVGFADDKEATRQFTLEVKRGGAYLSEKWFSGCAALLSGPLVPAATLVGGYVRSRAGFLLAQARVGCWSADAPHQGAGAAGGEKGVNRRWKRQNM